MNHPTEDGKYPIICFQPLLKLNVLVPEGMGQEIQPDTTGTSLEQPGYPSVSNHNSTQEKGGNYEKARYGKHEQGRPWLMNWVTKGDQSPIVRETERGSDQRVDWLDVNGWDDSFMQENSLGENGHG